MSSHKTYLVARREYVENLRTKTFWIGILSFPVILAIAFTVPRLLEKVRDVRKYTIVDNTGENFLDRIALEARRPVYEKIFADLEAAKTDPALAEKFPASVKAFVAGLDALPEETRALAKEALSQSSSLLLKIEAANRGEENEYSKISADERGKITEALRQTDEANPIAAWIKESPWSEVSDYATELTTHRFEFIPLERLGNASVEELTKKIDDGELFAFFEINGDPIAEVKGSNYYSQNLTDDDLKDWITNSATRVLQTERIAKADIDQTTAERIQERFFFAGKKVGAGGEATEATIQDRVREYAPIAFVYLLWIAVFTITQMLLTNTIEEKSNRIIEVLLSSVSPLQLMTGKILGIGATGLTMVGSWVICFLIGVKLFPAPAGLDFTPIISDPVYLSSFIAYFAGGYFLYAALLVGFGSVCNSLKEAQNLMQPVFILLIVPLLSMVPIAQDPNGTLARFMTYIPIFTPFIMMNRAAGPPAPYEYAITSVIIIASVAFAFWFAAKIFRIGILMTGKPPKVREIIGWLRAPVTSVPVRRETAS